MLSIIVAAYSQYIHSSPFILGMDHHWVTSPFANQLHPAAVQSESPCIASRRYVLHHPVLHGCRAVSRCHGSKATKINRTGCAIRQGVVDRQCGKAERSAPQAIQASGVNDPALIGNGEVLPGGCSDIQIHWDGRH